MRSRRAEGGVKIRANAALTVNKITRSSAEPSRAQTALGYQDEIREWVWLTCIDHAMPYVGRRREFIVRATDISNMWNLRSAANAVCRHFNNLSHKCPSLIHAYCTIPSGPLLLQKATEMFRCALVSPRSRETYLLPRMHVEKSRVAVQRRENAPARRVPPVLPREPEVMVPAVGRNASK